MSTPDPVPSSDFIRNIVEDDYRSGKYDGQRVGRDYVLEDGDVIELHS